MSRLDPRLAAAYDAVRPGSVVADVGADHAYLVCALVGDGRCPRGFASDVAAGPLEAARRHIREQGLQDRVRAVLSDGLAALPGGEIDDVVIAGMGGELIAEILTGPSWTRSPDKRFVLQPMTRAAHLRRSLCREGFQVLEETAVVAGRFAYSVMTAAYTGECREAGLRFAHTGLLWDRRDAAAQRYLRAVAARLEREACGCDAAGSTSEAAALRALAREIAEREDHP